MVGLALLYVPTYFDLSQHLWNTEEQGHGPLILLVSLFLMWQKRAEIFDQESAARGLLPWALLIGGLFLYIIGRSQDILVFEVGSQIPVLASAARFAGGRPALKALRFPILFLVFMVPLPGVVVDSITGPLKQNVSWIAEHLLYATGYPIARTGVTLTVGPYQLLVADACSGLHSMFSLFALGLLYLHLMKHSSNLRNALIILSVIPIAFTANVMRVMVLVLVTYHFGDEAGQGFVHGFAGMVLFAIALIFLFALDSVLGLLFREKSSTRYPVPSSRDAPSPKAS